MRTALLALVLVGCNQDISVDKVQPNLEVTPDPADVGDVLVGDTDQAELTLTRVSGGEVEIRSVTIENLSGDFFTWDETLPFVSNDAPGTLVITYAPTEIGWHEANVTITYNNEDEPSIEVGVRGHGVMGAARLYPSLLDFGAVPAGSAESKSITVVNEGDIALTLDGASFSDPRFTLNETTPLVIAPAGSMDVAFSFSADSDAAVEGTATLDFGGTVDLPDVFLRANDCEHGDPAIYDEDADGYTTCGGDCDDGEASAHPGGTEICNSVDDDCDGTTDETTSCYDDDGDGYTEDDGDCHDGEDAINPGMAEDMTNGIDDDCNGIVDGGGVDADGDGYGDAVDCSDADATSYPDAVELADGLDNDCDGLVDEGTELYDDDRDGQTEAAGDCDDADATVYRGAPERADYQDNDCDGTTDEGTNNADDDGDGFTENGGDCNDANTNVNPAAAEVSGNGVDDDCNGITS